MPNTDKETLILRAPFTGGELQLRCERVLDRFQNELFWNDENGAEIHLLQSVEGTPDDDFPPSPPIQQLHAQDINAVPVLLGVGMAGRGHWSASMVVNRVSDEPTPSIKSNIVVQHALNLRGDATWVGCTWAACDSVDWRLEPNPNNRSSPGMIVAALPGDRLFQICPHEPVGCELIVDSDANGKPLIVARPNETSTGQRPIRWDFEMNIVSE